MSGTSRQSNQSERQCTGSSALSLRTAQSTNPGSAPGSGTADDDDRGLKRNRRSKPKVKTGCTNCKQRRIKCDERRPACTQCVRSQKDCTGYPAPARSAAPFQEMQIAPRPAGQVLVAAAPPITGAGHGYISKEVVLPPRRVRRQQMKKSARAREVAASPTIYGPSYSLPLQGVEVLYFDLFRTRTATELSGYFDDVFWTRRVLQESHNEAPIMHAAVALGALYKTLEQSFKSPSPSGSDSEEKQVNSVMSHWQVAVKKYSEACNAMVHLQGQTQQAYRTRLMASVLLASFDAFIGDHKQAIVQIQSGLCLLDRWQIDQVTLPEPQEPIEEELIAMFTRLAIQAKSYDMAFHFPEPYVIHLTPGACAGACTQPATPQPQSKQHLPRVSIPLDGAFSSLREARQAHDHVTDGAMRFVERLSLAQRQPNPLFPESWMQYGMGIRGEMESWRRAFQPLLESRFHRSAQEKTAIAALQMSQTNIGILFAGLFNQSEGFFDVCKPQFQQLVDLGAEIVHDDESRAASSRCPYPEYCPHQRWDENAGAYVASHIKPSFSADLGIVPPLFVVATKCRDPHLRRRAIFLMRSSARREGMWDSEMAATISGWVIQVEEEGAAALQTRDPGDGHPEPPPTIPEDKRVMIQAVDFDLRTRVADVTVGTRAAKKTSLEEDSRFRTAHLSW